MAEISSFSKHHLRRFSTLAVPKPALTRRISFTAFHLREATAGLRKTISVTFVVEASVKLGNSIELLGNCSELGNWSFSHSLRLKTDAEAYPRWRSDPISFEIMGEDFTLEYKYVEVHAGDGSTESSLEGFEGNRKLTFVL